MPAHQEGTTEPKASHLPQDVYKLAPHFEDIKAPSDKILDALELYQRACNYLATAMIFLTKAPLEKEGFTQDIVKKRLLGHFGTCPGLSLVFAHTTLLIKETKEKFMLVTGPGHGAPGVLAALYLEGSISHFYPHCSMTRAGLDAFVKAFSWPGGGGPGTSFPSHINAETPGAIHEGGELGYALAVAYGSVMDKPDLITVVIIGDGEAETGPTATAWHAHKFIDHAESGAVIPILHANGFKISERTLFGTMDDKEVMALFSGYGYQVAIVEYENLAEPTPERDRKIQKDLYVAMRWALREIRIIQTAARSGKPIDKPRPPMIFLRSPKGWTGPRKLGDMPLVNSFHSHQVPLPEARTDKTQFKMLQDWLASYQPEALFNANADSEGGIVRPEVLEIVPEEAALHLGQLKDSYDAYRPLDLPADWKKLAQKPGKDVSPMKAIGSYLDEVIKRNPHDFRIFSPDELASNKLNSVLSYTTRNLQWDPETSHVGGRVTEMLSEHTLQGFLQGYALTGRYGLFPSYEAFLAIVDTMIVQFAKFIAVGLTTRWRGPIPGLTYIETSTLWRQEHNGFSHQAPGLIDTVLNLPHHVVRVYLPPDGNSAISVIDHCLHSKNMVQLIVGSKSPGPNWLDAEQAARHCMAGASMWPAYSTNEGQDPDVVIVGIGVETNTEAIQAVKVLEKELPDVQLKIRFVNVVDLLVLAEPGQHPHAMDEDAFVSLFTANKPVVINFHGYPSAVKQLLFSRTQSVHRSRITVLGYIEEGTTTTPFSMLRMNSADRWSVAEAAVRAMMRSEEGKGKVSGYGHSFITLMQHNKREHEKYVVENGEDPPDLSTGMLFEQ